MRVQFEARGTMAGPPARGWRSIGEAVARRGRATAVKMVEKSILKVFGIDWKVVDVWCYCRWL
jgi:hypothetical protein